MLEDPVAFVLHIPQDDSRLEFLRCLGIVDTVVILADADLRYFKVVRLLHPRDLLESLRVVFDHLHSVVHQQTQVEDVRLYGHEVAVVCVLIQLLVFVVLEVEDTQVVLLLLHVATHHHEPQVRVGHIHGLQGVGPPLPDVVLRLAPEEFVVLPVDISRFSLLILLWVIQLAQTARLIVHLICYFSQVFF